MPKTRFRKEHLRAQKIAAGHLKSTQGKNRKQSELAAKSKQN